MQIHDYAAAGDIEGVKKELRRGAFVDDRNEQDLTPLAVAAGSLASDVAMLQLLIDAGADVNAAVDDSKRFPVSLAADSGDLSKLLSLLDAGADVNAASPQGYTPLINVLYHLWDDQKLLPVVELLVKHGADIDAVTSYGESPLTTAAFQGRLDVVRFLLDAGANAERLAWTPAMMATCLGTLEELQGILDKGGELDQRDYFDRTVWLLSAIVGDVRKAQLLHEHGIDIEERGRMGDTALANCVSRGHVPMARWLIQIGANVNNPDDSGNTPLMIAAQSGQAESVQLLLDAGADPGAKNTYDQTALSMASSASVVRELVKAGEDLTEISTDMRRSLTQMSGSETLEVTLEQYLSGRYPRFGRSNPEEMKIPFWQEMVRTGINAYRAKKQFDDDSNYDNAVWCFDRFGTSFTELPDGRFVQIGGEHEDYYDPDFCIYNDVFVHEASGTFQIFGYPRDVFPPTDFHTATSFQGFIYIIGGLGYHGQRQFGTTPVYRLDCKTWKIQLIETSGDNPGWIFKHKARLTDENVVTISGGTVCSDTTGQEMHIENTDQFELNLSTLTWRRID